MSGLEKIYCSVPTQKSFLPSVMFPNSTVLFHTTLNSPTQLSAPCRATQEKCRSTSLKKFTRKCSKLARDAAQRLQKFPLSLPKCDGQIRTALSPGALYPPFNVHEINPLLPISRSILTNCYRGGAQDLSSETSFLPKSLLEISNRGGGDGPVNFLSTLKGFTLPKLQYHITLLQ